MNIIEPKKKNNLNKLKGLNTYQYYARIKVHAKIIVHKLLTFAKSLPEVSKANQRLTSTWNASIIQFVSQRVHFAKLHHSLKLLSYLNTVNIVLS